MAFNFAAAKLKVRQVVHATLGVSALYTDDVVIDAVEIKARWHSTDAMFGKLFQSDFSNPAQIYDSINQIVFANCDADTLGVKRGGKLVFPEYENLEVTLQQRLPKDGPYEQIWQVSRD